MALIQIPYDMTEFRVMIEQLKELGKTIDKQQEQDLLKQAVVDNTQSLLDEALDGHYYSCKMEDKNLTIYDALNEPTGTIEPLGDDFLEDFKGDADALWNHVATKLAKILGAR